MLIVAIILALFLIYLINAQPTFEQKMFKHTQRRVGGVFAYNDMFDPTHQDRLPINTVNGPGGGSLVKKFA
jgi:hypothetical protein